MIVGAAGWRIVICLLLFLCFMGSLLQGDSAVLVLACKSVLDIECGLHRSLRVVYPLPTNMNLLPSLPQPSDARHLPSLTMFRMSIESM